MKSQTICQGAEAIIQKQDSNIIKNRIKKSYRHPVLDNKLRKTRTKSEAKIIEKLQNIIPVPKMIETNNQDQIIMQHIPGKKLSEHLEQLNWKQICKQIAQNLTNLHNSDIIHSDLTTSNMILNDIDNKLYFIDFGLSFHSHKVEDKAVDLHLLKQALEAKHFTIHKQAEKIILNNYNPENKKQILERIKAIEKRGRYKGH